jgi:hypothetical protein
MDDGHIGAKVHYVLHNVRGEDHNNLLSHFSQKIVKTVALAGVKTGGGLVRDQQLRIADQRLSNAKALAHASGKSGQSFLAHFIQKCSAAAWRPQFLCAHGHWSCL